jgi:hypothetical protein
LDDARHAIAGRRGPYVRDRVIQGHMGSGLDGTISACRSGGKRLHRTIWSTEWINVIEGTEGKGDSAQALIDRVRLLRSDQPGECSAHSAQKANFFDRRRLGCVIDVIAHGESLAGKRQDFNALAEVLPDCAAGGVIRGTGGLRVGESEAIVIG